MRIHIRSLRRMNFPFFASKVPIKPKSKFSSILPKLASTSTDRPRAPNVPRTPLRNRYGDKANDQSPESPADGFFVAGGSLFVLPGLGHFFGVRYSRRGRGVFRAGVRVR